jgi:hypothetical protein
MDFIKITSRVGNVLQFIFDNFSKRLLSIFTASLYLCSFIVDTNLLRQIEVYYCCLNTVDTGILQNYFGFNIHNIKKSLK